VDVGLGALGTLYGEVRIQARLVFTVSHPYFEQPWQSWRAHGEYRTSRYLAEHEIHGPSGVDFHRTISTYQNQLVRFGCYLAGLVERYTSASLDASMGCQVEQGTPHALG
jgi:hypothetical protein